MKFIIPLFFMLLGSNSFSQFYFERSDFIDALKNGNVQDLAWAGGMNYVQFSNIDLDYDGNMDLFVFDRSSNKWMTFLHSGNSGTTEYTYAPEYESAFPPMTSWVLLRDYNCDGKMDIFGHTSAGIMIYENVGDSGSGLAFEKKTSPFIFTLFYTSIVNLYVSSGDIPGIIDVDSDGDLDILTFGLSGSTVEYHKNLSMEMYGVCDSLVYELKNECWGRFTESTVSNSVNLWDTLVYPCNGATISNPEYPEWDFDPRDIPIRERGERARHVGSTLLAFDNNSDTIIDLLLGDIQASSMVYTENYGTIPNTNSGMGFQDVNFPSNTTPIDVKFFPAAFYVDIDMDGKRELVVSPNTTSFCVDMESVWHYQNNGTDTSPIFSFSQTDLLQDRMIDNGVGAYPVFFDHDGDGLKDLIVANSYYYNVTDNANYSTLAYYKNTGTAALPEFTFVTSNYANIENTGFNINIYPTFGDVDNDGDEDMYIGDLDGGIHFFENTAGAGNPAVFAAPVLNVVDASGATIDVGQYSTPLLKDMNRDGLYDLVVGSKIGTLHYYENTGTDFLPKFTLQTTNFGGVNTVESTGVYGYSVPSIVDYLGEYQLFVGSFSGFLHYYTDLDANLSGNFTLIDTLYQGIRDGKQSGVAVEDLDGDGNFELFYGTKRGGITLYESNSNLGIEDVANLGDDFNLYPNPTNNMITVDFTHSKNNFYGSDLKIFNTVGQLILSRKINQNKIIINLSGYTQGVYILSVLIDGVQVNKKIIKK